VNLALVAAFVAGDQDIAYITWAQSFTEQGEAARPEQRVHERLGADGPDAALTPDAHCADSKKP